MAFQPANNLGNRTFVGLIIAQFLSGFNDQAIHAASMFYALRTGALDEAQAISLMPILFYAPSAIFSTLAGYFADRFSKTYGIRIWKFSEIVISLILIGGFWLGSHKLLIGPWIVLACVFLMGTHAAFFAPAKYGAMPQTLQPQILSKGNGVLESTTFLAAIFGTVTGGLLSNVFRDHEIWIGVILLVLSILGSVASLMMDILPASNVQRTFPYNLYKPLWDNSKLVFRIRALAFAILGIAFFVFMVAYMRSTMYMHGQSRIPRWDEFYTSLIVATVALGVGIGSPLAGNLSGGKVELGLVPIGTMGMVAAALLAASFIDRTWVLIVSLIGIGFFSGFYMVPLYTLLQHRAPKDRKGDIVALSNFTNVTGAIVASLLFFLLVKGCQMLEITPLLAQTTIGQGVLKELKQDEHHLVSKFVIDLPNGESLTKVSKIEDFDELEENSGKDHVFLELVSTRLKEGDQVVATRYELGGVQHFLLRNASQPEKKVYNNVRLPRFLFFGAALMTLATMLLLYWKLPDFFVRALFWWRSLNRYKIIAIGMEHLPTQGPVIMTTNCRTLHEGLQLVSVTDRATTMVLLEEGPIQDAGTLVRTLALREGICTLNADSSPASDWDKAKQRAVAALTAGHLLAVSVDGSYAPSTVERFLAELQATTHAPLIPVHCGPSESGAKTQRIHVIFGEAVAAGISVEELRLRIRNLGDGSHDNQAMGSH